MKIFKTRFFWVALAALACVALVSNLKKSEREVWIATSANAFVGPGLGLGPEVINPEDLAIGITPAPWPKEAREIYYAAKNGTIVHVTINSNNEKLTFDINGLSPNGHLLVSKRSMSNVERVTKILLGDAQQENYDGNRIN